MKRICLVAIGLLLAFTIGCSDRSQESADAVEPDSTDSAEDTAEDTTDDSTDTADDDPTDTRASNDASDTTEMDAQGAGGDEGLHPRWILYDGNDEPVEAVVLVGEHTRPGPAYDAWSVGDQVTPNAYTKGGIATNSVHVLAIGDRVTPYKLQLDLESGDIKGTTEEFYYKDSECEGQPYYPPRVVALRSDPVMWTKGTVEAVDADQVYKTEPGSHCQGDSTPPDQLVEVQPVPDWLQNAFPNPPYTVKPAY